MTVIDTPEGINFVQLVARKGALRLEMLGMRGRGPSAYSIIKSEYGLKGSRESVLAQMDTLIEKAFAVRSGNA
jgi:hypothetical protein